MVNHTNQPHQQILYQSLLLVAALLIHLAIVASILSDGRAIIWPLHNDTIHRRGEGIDFYAVYHAGVNLSKGISPYDNAPDGVTPYFYPFRYLPIVAQVAQLLLNFSPQTAYFLWIILLELVLAAVIWTLWRRIANPTHRLATVALLLLNSPYFLELYMGQFTFISVALAYLGLLLSAGSLLFLVSVLLKPLSLVALPAMLRERQHWLAALLAIVALLLLSVPYFMREPEQWRVFFDSNFKLVGGLDTGNYGLVYLLSLLADNFKFAPLLQYWSEVIGGYRLLLLGITAVFVLLSRKSFVLVDVSALLLAHFLTYQHVWEHHLSGVCVVAAILMAVSDFNKRQYQLVLACLFLLAIPTPFGLFDVAKDPTVWDPSIDWPRYATYLVALAKVVPTMLLYVITMLALLRHGLMHPRDAFRQLRHR